MYTFTYSRTHVNIHKSTCTLMHAHTHTNTHTNPCVYRQKGRQSGQCRQTNTQAGWQAGKEDRCMHTLIVIQTHALFVSAQTDKQTHRRAGGLAGRQGRRTYAYTDTVTLTVIQTHALHTPACGAVPASCVADVCSIFW